MFNTRALWGVLGLTLLLGCAHQPKRLPDADDEPFRIGRADVLEISVWRDPELSRVVPVRPDGFISLPMIGEVKAEGKAPGELAETLKAKLSPFIQEPRVTVLVREVHSRRVYVTGEVAHPGSYPLVGRVSVLQAVALAGGFSDFANKEGILVIRPGPGGGQYPVRYSDLISGDDSRGAAILRAGDTVVVP